VCTHEAHRLLLLRHYLYFCTSKASKVSTCFCCAAPAYEQPRNLSRKRPHLHVHTQGARFISLVTSLKRHAAKAECVTTSQDLGSNRSIGVTWHTGSIEFSIHATCALMCVCVCMCVCYFNSESISDVVIESAAITLCRS
jgi:hypothetical protein